MIQRKSVNSSRHDVLDFAYLAAFFIGVIQLTEVIKATSLGHGSASISLLGFQMLAMASCGIIAYVFHLKNLLQKELIVIIPILTGFITLGIGSALEEAYSPYTEPFFVNLGGLSVVVTAWLIMELSKRFYFIQIYCRQLMKTNEQIEASRRTRGEVETPVSMEVINEKAKEISDQILGE